MKPCPHFLKRFAVLAAASLILSAVTLSASAAAAPVKYEEKRSTVTTVDGAQKKEDLAVTVEYQIGSTSIRAYTVEKDEVIGVSKDMWSLYGAFTSDWITDGTYTLSQPLNSVEQDHCKRSLRRHSPHERELFCIPCSRRHRRHYSFLEL